MKIGYARVSTTEQTLDLQRDALRAAGAEEIYEDTASGSSRQRAGLESCIRALRAGDTLVVWRLDRLGRSLTDLVHLVRDLEQRGVKLASLTEQLETETASGRLQFQLFATLAEFERNLLKERTMAGLRAARARGRQGGRPRKLTEKEALEVRRLFSDRSVPLSTIAKRYGVCRGTIYRYAKI